MNAEDLSPDRAAAVGEAASWLATEPASSRPSPIIPALREKFGLSATEAVAATREAALIRARAI